MNTINHENFKLSSLKHNPTKKEIKIKNAVFGPNEIQLIMGPCAIESREQLEETAKEVKTLDKNFGHVHTNQEHTLLFQGMGKRNTNSFKIGEKYDLITETE